MARLIKAVKERRGRKRKYPWAEWMDGKARRAVKGTDFDGSPRNFYNAAAQTARRNKRKLKGSIGADYVDFAFSK